MSDSALLSFLNKAAWCPAQHHCPHLSHKARPSHKARNLKHLWCYLGVATLDEQGLINVNKEDPFASRQSLTVIPHKLLSSIATVIVLYTKHSSKHQLKLVFNRHFFDINSNTIINQVVDQCSQCNALKSIPKQVFSQSSSLASNSLVKYSLQIFYVEIVKRYA